jgi:hypothetical protein
MPLAGKVQSCGGLCGVDQRAGCDPYDVGWFVDRSRVASTRDAF